MPTRPEELHPALAAAYNAGDLDALSAVYDPDAAFVVKPGHVTEGPTELRAALRELIERGFHLAIHPDSFVRSGDVVLALGRYTLSGRRRDGTPFENDFGFADILRRQPDGRWLIAVDNGFAGG
jgi:ketosteroid isomerase-like protein